MAEARAVERGGELDPGPSTVFRSRPRRAWSTASGAAATRGLPRRGRGPRRARACGRSWVLRFVLTGYGARAIRDSMSRCSDGDPDSLPRQPLSHCCWPGAPGRRTTRGRRRGPHRARSGDRVERGARGSRRTRNRRRAGGPEAAARGGDVRRPPDARALHALGPHRRRHRRLPLLPARPGAGARTRSSPASTCCPGNPDVVHHVIMFQVPPDRVAQARADRRGQPGRGLDLLRRLRRRRGRGSRWTRPRGSAPGLRAAAAPCTARASASRSPPAPR